MRHIKDSIEDKNIVPLKLKCYICQKTDHLALWCPKYPKWRGNLIKLFLNQNKVEKSEPSEKE